MSSSKVLVIGLDGGTFTVLEPFAREGLIPNLARLMETGARGVLRSTVPPISAPAWATFQTGKNPGGHGLFNFFDWSKSGFRSSHDFRTSRVVNHSNIGSPTVYDYLRAGGRKVISVNIPLTYPTPQVDGALVACWLTPPGSRDFTWPRTVAGEIPEYRIDQDFGQGMYALTPEGTELDSDQLFDDLTDILERRADATRHLLTSRPWDVAMVCFTETDRIQHYFWRAINPKHPDYGTPKGAHERKRFKGFFTALDARVGDLVEAVGPDADVFVISDHGFGPPPTRRYHLTHWMRERGWLVTAAARPERESGGNGNGGAGPGPRRARASAVVGAGKALWKRLVPPSLRDQIYARVGYSPAPVVVDWEKTRAWSFGVNNNLGAICINERDTAGEGCVAPGAETTALVDEIARGLMELRDPATGRPVVQEVMRREEMYDGPYADRFPHLLARLDPDFEADFESGFVVTGWRIQSHDVYPSGRGNHHPDGICIAAGPRIVAGEMPAHDLADVMPTLLHLAGLPVPDDLDGRVMTDHLRADWRQVRTGPAQPAGAHRFAEPSAEDVERLQEKLRQLGYM